MILNTHFDSYEETLSFLNESEDDLWELECEYDGLDSDLEDESGDSKASSG